MSHENCPECEYEARQDIQRWFSREDVAWLVGLESRMEPTPIFDALASDYSVGLAIRIESD